MPDYVSINGELITLARHEKNLREAAEVKPIKVIVKPVEVIKPNRVELIKKVVKRRKRRK